MNYLGVMTDQAKLGDHLEPHMSTPGSHRGPLGQFLARLPNMDQNDTQLLTLPCVSLACSLAPVSLNAVLLCSSLEFWSVCENGEQAMLCGPKTTTVNTIWVIFDQICLSKCTVGQLS